VAGGPDAVTVALADTDSSTPTSATILVVDDSPVNLRLVVRTLEGRGYRLLAAKNGRAALDIARRVRPDLILLDVMMPEMDGFEVCRALKSDPHTRDAIIVFLSALGEVTDKVTGLELGASDYITKPIQAEEVIARVANHVARQQLEREVRRSRDRLERELESAGAMQRRILPAVLPSGHGATFAAYYRTSLYAGGDYYDVFTLPDGQFGVIVADVSGHGAPAAIIMAMIRAAVHAFPGFACDPSELLRYLNRHFQFLWESPMFATALSALVDPRDRSLTIACAGHPPPLLLRKGRVSQLPVQATMPVLMMDLPNVPQVQHALEPGDRVLFYTDGVTERYDPQDDMYDLPRLMSAVEETANLSPAEQVNALVSELDAFAGEREPEDDQTLLLMAIEAGL
jgi:sigma-B regulation protein RsbU (phosphoserine phosphatase)